ncbi:hypothetical protein MKY34_17570 [Sporosarcina sp. FSL K6-1522]|uniref:hypothetical protein n=1 Tax=Sporosarcina sp. FSL K6-1522 TaxID=2921554 RepID=UPI00315A122F
MNRILLIAINIITGIVAITMSVVSYAMSGIGEGSTNNIAYLGWILVWAMGLALQFKQRTRIVGLFITFAPIAFFSYVFIVASMM